MKKYLLLLLVMVTGQSYAAGDCKVKDWDGSDDNSTVGYKGECQNGYAHGKGTLTYPRAIYYGEWKNGFQDGYVRKYLQKKDKYVDVFYIYGDLVMTSEECESKNCNINNDPYDGLDQKTKTDIWMSKITTAMKENKFRDALLYMAFLEKYNNNLPESFYFYQIRCLANTTNKEYHHRSAVLQIKLKEYLKRYSSKGKYYAEVIEIMGR